MGKLRVLVMLLFALFAGALLSSLFRGSELDRQKGSKSVAELVTTQSRDDQPREDETRIREMEKLLRMNSDRLSAIERLTEDRNRAEEVGAHGSGEEARFGATTTPEDEARWREREREILTELTSSENRDSEWADDYEGQIDSNLRDHFPEDKITEISCKTSVCRVLVQHASDRDRQAFFEKSPKVWPAAAAARYETFAMNDGTWNTEIHIVRQGFEVPIPRNEGE